MRETNLDRDRARTRVSLALCAAGLAALLAQAACGPSPRPNVLLITVDTLRADHVGCYGYLPAHTPAIDRLAAEGVRCSDAAAVAPITLPSHCSIMTGLYPPTHGVRDNGNYGLGDDTVTLAERLKAAGYTTKAIVSAVVLSRRYNLCKGFDDYDDNLWSEDEPTLFLVRDRKAAKTAARFVAWLDGWAKQPKRKPFFAWVHLYDPHAPYDPPPEFRALTRSPYDDEVASADHGIGTMIAALRARGELDRTLVVVTADHGESLGEHGEKTHALFIYDATIHVPLIWRYPRLFRAGQMYDAPVSSVDIVPTILAALRLPGGDQTQGIDLLPALQGKTAPPDRPQYSESLLSEVGFGMAPLYGIRRDGTEWIRAPKPEVYDLRRDPHELHNIYASSPNVAIRLDRELQQILDASERIKRTPRAETLDRETLQTLRSLGYMAGGQERTSMAGMDPKDGIGIYNQLEDARHLCQKRRWQAGEVELRKILAVVPSHITARNILALVLQREGRVEEAKAEYEQSLRQDPKQPRIYGILAILEMGDDRLDRAEADLGRALAITPHFVEAICNMGFIAALRGQDAVARQWYDRAVAEDPDFPRVYRRIADLYYEKQDYASALTYYTRALKRGPGDFPALIQCGNCERHLGHPAEAGEYFRTAAAARPDSWIPAYNLGCLAAAAGERQAAVAELEAAVARGFRNADTLRDDPDWNPVRHDPAFAAAAVKVERAWAAAGREASPDPTAP